MRPVRLTRSIGFRLAIGFTAVFLLGAAIAGLVSYGFIRQELRGRHERAVTETLALFADTYESDGGPALIGEVKAHADAARSGDTLYRLTGPDGAVLAGSLQELPAGMASPAPATALGLSADYDYFLGARTFGPYRLTVANSGEDISELEEIILRGGLWAGLVLGAVALAGGVALSTRMQQRIGAIQTVLEQVANGRFGARVARTGNGDDLDALAGIVNDTVARLAVSVESMRQISNDIAHDLKTPLNRLRIRLETALESHGNGWTDFAELEAALDETDSIIATFDALLRIAQIESGARKARFSPIDPGHVLEEMTGFYQALAEDEGRRLIFTGDAAAGRIRGDRELLAQLFANLIENALRHCPPGAVITCAARREGDRIVASIADNGPGIPEAEREKVLRRLYRMEQSRTTRGSGLGLAMVKAVADLHEARLTLSDNAPGLRVEVSFAAGVG
ncbi:MAG: ATP-binding protein [Paracoccaceae bacterium]